MACRMPGPRQGPLLAAERCTAIVDPSSPARKHTRVWLSTATATQPLGLTNRAAAPEMLDTTTGAAVRETRAACRLEIRQRHNLDARWVGPAFTVCNTTPERASARFAPKARPWADSRRLEPRMLIDGRAFGLA